MTGYNANIWKGIELRIDPDPVCTSCQISPMNKRVRYKNPINPKAPFKWVFMDNIPATAKKILTSETTTSIYILIVDPYSKIPKLYGMERIIIEEVMDKLDMIQSRFGKLYKFGWWDLEIISADVGTQFISTDFQDA